MADTMPFDLDEFLNGLNRDSSKERTGSSDRVTKLLMNTRDNQGTAKIIPFISKKIKNFYCKIEKVREFKAPTSIIETEDDIWYKILPKEFYEGMTPVQEELYNEVIGLYDSIWDWDTLEWDQIRRRNYALFTGICAGLVNREGTENDEMNGSPCLFIYPSTTPIDALNTAIATKRTSLKENTGRFLTKIFSPSNSGREGLIAVTFKKGDVGYDSAVSLEVNSEYSQVSDPTIEYSEDVVKKFDDPIESFLGWMYDNEAKSYFNEKAFKELRDYLKLQLKQLEASNEAEDSNSSETPTENKNDQVDPMVGNKPPVPGADGTASQKKKTAPF